jgi:hypothetical protein
MKLSMKFLSCVRSFSVWSASFSIYSSVYHGANFAAVLTKSTASGNELYDATVLPPGYFFVNGRCMRILSVGHSQKNSNGTELNIVSNGMS